MGLTEIMRANYIGNIQKFPVNLTKWNKQIILLSCPQTTSFAHTFDYTIKEQLFRCFSNISIKK